MFVSYLDKYTRYWGTNFTVLCKLSFVDIYVLWYHEDFWEFKEVSICYSKVCDETCLYCCCWWYMRMHWGLETCDNVVLASIYLNIRLIE